jgi:cyclophilin family peptidyl-prolyl cis-trans isomerase
MSSTSPLPPGIEGQEAPSRLELLWYQYRNYVYAALGFGALAIAVSYWLEYSAQQARDERWTRVSEAVALDRGYATSDESWSAFSANEQLRSYGIFQARASLVSKLPQQLESLDPQKIQAEIDQAPKSAKPLLMLAKARALTERGSWDEALATLDKLSSDYPNHFLNRETPYPIQFRPPVEKDEDDTKPAVGEDDLEPAKAGSEVALLRARIEAERAFHAEHPGFYKPAEPTSEDVLTFRFAEYGDVKVRLFDQQAPEHCKLLRQLAADNWWQGMRVHRLVRGPAQQPWVERGEFLIGLPSTRADDRTDWKVGEKPAEEHLLEWEETDLSHFPGTLAVVPAADGKSQVEQLVFVAVDAAAEKDGDRVIVGRVVEGLDIVQEIVDSPFSQESEANAGEGLPESNIALESVTIE